MTLASDRVETRLPDLKPALTEAQARAEAARCLFCHDAPCVAACPTEALSFGFTRPALGAARAAGFRSISVDLIFGTPGETVPSWEASVRAATELGVDRIVPWAASRTGLALGAVGRRGARSAAAALRSPAFLCNARSALGSRRLITASR